MHRSSLPSAAATAILPQLDAPSPLPTRDSPANDELPVDDGAAASPELTHYLTEEHDRIAQGMNHVVVRRIFAAGLDLQDALGLINDHRAASKIWQHAAAGRRGPGLSAWPGRHRNRRPAGSRRRRTCAKATSATATRQGT